MMKNPYILLLGLLLFCHVVIYSQDDLFGDEASFDASVTTDWLSSAHFATTRSQAQPEDVVAILIDLGALNLLQADIYKRTNPLNIRSLLDYPSYIPLKYSSAPWTTSAVIFYNHTDRDFFTRTSDAISSYLGVCDPNLLEFLSNEVLEEMIRQQFPDYNLSPVDILPLFKNMTIQERRLGIMFEGMKRCSNRSRFRFMFPLYYLESNFWLTEDEQRAIEARLGSDPNQDQFAEDYLISDKIGMGDLRLTYDTPIIDRPFFHLRGGILATIPVSFAFKKGLKGSKFSKLTEQPPFDLLKLFCDAQGSSTEQAQAAQQGLCFFLNTLKHLSANLVEVPLGNGRHFGIGGYIRYKSYLRNFIPRRWAENVTFNSYASLELLLPKNHRRFYIEESDKEEFAALGLNKNISSIKDRISDDPEYANEVLSFMEKQFTQKFFPFALNTLVWPGFVFRWTTRANYEGQRWGVQAGFDTWVQAKEQIGNICIPSTIPQDLNIECARRPLAYQWKLFGSIFLKKRDNDDNWIFSLTSDYTLASSGIGGDYTLALNIGRHF